MSDLKKCPFCAEMIDVKAEKCPYCGEELAASQATAAGAQPNPPPDSRFAGSAGNPVQVQPGQTIIVQQPANDGRGAAKAAIIFLILSIIVQAIACCLPVIGPLIGLIFYGPLYVITFILCIVCLCKSQMGVGCFGLLLILIMPWILMFGMPLLVLGSPLKLPVEEPGKKENDEEKSKEEKKEKEEPKEKPVVQPFQNIPVSRFWSDTKFTCFPLQPLPKPYFSHFSNQQQSKYIRLDDLMAAVHSELTVRLTNTSSQPIYGIAFSLKGHPDINSEKKYSCFFEMQPWMPGQTITITGKGPNMYLTSNPFKPDCVPAWFTDLMIVFADDFYFQSQITNGRTTESKYPELYRGIRAGISLRELKEQLYQLTGQHNSESQSEGDSYDGSGILKTRIGNNWALFYFTRNGKKLYKVVIVFGPDYEYKAVLDLMQKAYGTMKDGVIRTNFDNDICAFGEYRAKTAEKDGVVFGLLELSQKPINFVKGTVSRKIEGSPLNYHGFKPDFWSHFAEHAKLKEYPTRLPDKPGICKYAAIIYDKALEDSHVKNFDLWMQRVAEGHRLIGMLNIEKAKVKFKKKHEIFGVYEPEAPVLSGGLLKMPELSTAVMKDLNTLPQKMRCPLALWAKYLFFAQKFRQTNEQPQKELLRQQCLFLNCYVKTVAPDAAKCPDDAKPIVIDKGTQDDYMKLVIRSWREYEPIFLEQEKHAAAAARQLAMERSTMKSNSDLLKMPELSSEANAKLVAFPEILRYPMALLAKYYLVADVAKRMNSDDPEKKLRQQDADFIFQNLKRISPLLIYDFDFKNIGIRINRGNFTPERYLYSIMDDVKEKMTNKELAAKVQIAAASRPRRTTEPIKPNQQSAPAPQPEPAKPELQPMQPPEQITPRQLAQRLISAIEQIDDIFTIEFTAAFVIQNRNGLSFLANVTVKRNDEGYRQRIFKILNEAGFKKVAFWSSRDNNFHIAFSNQIFCLPSNAIDGQMFYDHFCKKLKYPCIDMTMMSRKQLVFSSLQAFNVPLVSYRRNLYTIWSPRRFGGNYFLVEKYPSSSIPTFGNEIKFSPVRADFAPKGTRIFNPGHSRHRNRNTRPIVMQQIFEK